MTYPYRLVVFDWEGTVADPLGAVVHFLWTEVNQLGWEAFSQSQVRHHLLSGLSNAIKTMCVGLSEQQMHALEERAERAVTQERHKVFVFAGIKALLQQLHDAGIYCAVASNKSQSSLEHAIVASELLPYFCCYRGTGILAPKPSPDMLVDIIEHVHINPEQVVMIGDSFADVEMARSMNIDAIAIDWYASGVWHPDRMGAKAVVSTIEHLASLLGVQLSSGEKIEHGV